jgi:carboxymethylenebutenolidase
MCDEFTEADNAGILSDGHLSRRAFGALAGVGGLSLLIPSPANALPTKGRDVLIDTPDGKADAYFVAPAKGKHPAVLIWPDIMSLRPAFRQMADRLAESGYAVLVVNLYYRSQKAPVLAPGENFGQPPVRERLMPLAQKVNATTNVVDAKAFIAFIDAQPEVDTKRGMATTGYCMGGPLTMRTAAAVPGRIKAGASFHGGGVATDKPDSPHLLVPQMKASYLFAIADNDDQRDPESKNRLRAAFDAAKLPAEIEVYKGAMHGWCPPDSAVYNAEQAEKAWARMLELFKKAL